MRNYKKYMDGVEVSPELHERLSHLTPAKGPAPWKKYGAMAAALVAHARGASAQTTENAAEIALEHHLGLTCDPVGGYVQIPCIERNAMGAVKAYNAFLLASTENPYHHRVSLDSAIAAMAETGREMNAKFKETSLGGLAVSMVNC